MPDISRKSYDKAQDLMGNKKAAVKKTNRAAGRVFSIGNEKGAR
jgi:hypothetical protein